MLLHLSACASYTVRSAGWPLRLMWGWALPGVHAMGSPFTGLEKTNRPQSTMVKLAPTSSWTYHLLPDVMLGHFRQREGPCWGHAGAGATETGVWLRTSSSRVGFLVPSSLRQGVLGSHEATFKGPVELFAIASDTCGQPGCCAQLSRRNAVAYRKLRKASVVSHSREAVYWFGGEQEKCPQGRRVCEEPGPVQVSFALGDRM